MPGTPGKSWQEIKRQKPLNETRMAIYERLIEAEQLIADARSRHGVTDIAITEALVAIGEPDDSSAAPDCDVYLSALGRYVAALGGHLELRAVFPEESIVVPCGADRQDPSDPA